MTLTFTETTVPEQATAGRARQPNPFDGKFPTPEGKALQVVLPAKSDEDTKALNRVKAQAQDAAKRATDDAHPSGYSARVKWESDAKAKTVTLTIWTVDRITRPRKGTESK